jgi:hypothetical protein
MIRYSRFVLAGLFFLWASSVAQAQSSPDGTPPEQAPVNPFAVEPPPATQPTSDEDPIATDIPAEQVIPATPPALFDSSHIVVQTAGKWSNYQQDVYRWGSHNIASANELETALIDLARYDGQAMAPGWMATNALIVLQIPEFVSGVHAWEEQYGHDLILSRLHENVMFSTMFPGADQAGAGVLRAARSDASRIKLVGSLFKEQAYSMQKQSWANRKQGGKTLRLASIRSAPASPKGVATETLLALAAPGLAGASAPYDPDQAKATFLSALKLGPRSAWASTASSAHIPKAARGREQTMAQVLAIAALMVLAEDPSHADFRKWLNDRELRECVDWSRVHLAQCIAAGHFVFESSFCIAEHQLIDAGECVESVASGAIH